MRLIKDGRLVTAQPLVSVFPRPRRSRGISFVPIAGSVYRRMARPGDLSGTAAAGGALIRDATELWPGLACSPRSRWELSPAHGMPTGPTDPGELCSASASRRRRCGAALRSKAQLASARHWGAVGRGVLQRLTVTLAPQEAGQARRRARQRGGAAGPAGGATSSRALLDGVRAVFCAPGVWCEVRNLVSDRQDGAWSAAFLGRNGTSQAAGLRFPGGASANLGKTTHRAQELSVSRAKLRPRPAALMAYYGVRSSRQQGNETAGTPSPLLPGRRAPPWSRYGTAPPWARARACSTDLREVRTRTPASPVAAGLVPSGPRPWGGGAATRMHDHHPVPATDGPLPRDHSPSVPPIPQRSSSRPACSELKQRGSRRRARSPIRAAARPRPP